ncbi:hypothetical protein ACOSQ4_031683 [Xanthoceras sorbifolium]
MPLDSYELNPSELVPSVEGSRSREEYVTKAKSSWVHDESFNPRLKEESSSGSIMRSKDIPDPDIGSATSIARERSSPIVVEYYLLVKSLRHPITRSARKLSHLSQRQRLVVARCPRLRFFSLGARKLPSVGQDHLRPPKDKVVISYWALEFGLRLSIKPFFRKLFVNL